MSKPATRINVLSTTGLVVIEGGYGLRDKIKQEGGRFQPSAVGDIVAAKSWVIKTLNDSDARTLAKFLKKSARSAGLEAQVCPTFY
ncbi:unnamed protein product [Pylaiella littoralis]